MLLDISQVSFVTGINVFVFVCAVAAADDDDNLADEDEDGNHLRKNITADVQNKSTQLAMTLPVLLFSKFVNLGDPNSWKRAPIAASSAWL